MVFFSNQNKIDSEKKNLNKVSVKGGISLISIFFFFSIFPLQFSEAGFLEEVGFFGKKSPETRKFLNLVRKEWKAFHPTIRDWNISQSSVLALFEQQELTRDVLSQNPPVSLKFKRTWKSYLQFHPIVDVPEKYRKAQLRKLLNGKIYLDFSKGLGRGGVKSWRELIELDSGQHFAVTTMPKSNRFDTLLEILQIAQEEPQSKLMRMQYYDEGIEVQLLTDVFNTDLGHYLEKNRPDIHFKKQLIEDLCSSVSTLHRHRILHADLKPENILLKWDATTSVEEGSTDHISKMDRMYSHFALGDFDFAYHFDDQEKTTTTVGSFPYSPPEAFLKRLETNPVLVARRDTFGVGMLALLLFYPELWNDTENAKELRLIWTQVPSAIQAIEAQGSALKEKKESLRSIQENILQDQLRLHLTDDEMANTEDAKLVELIHQKAIIARHIKQIETKINEYRETIQDAFEEMAEKFDLFQHDIDLFKVPEDSHSEQKIKHTHLFELIKKAIKIDVNERLDLDVFCSQFPSTFAEGS